MKQKWLIVSYYANVNGRACSHHIDDRIPYFKQKIDLYLLSSICCSKNKNISHLRVPSIAPSGIIYEVRQFLKQKIKNKFWYKVLSSIILPLRPFYFLEKMIFNGLFRFQFDSSWSWALSGLIAGLYIIKKERPSVIYTTGGPISAHMVGLIISKLTKVKWIVEFQDPLFYQYPSINKKDRNKESWFIAWIEKEICRNADKVIFLTKAARDSAERRNGYGYRLVTIYPGADENLFSGMSAGKYRINYDEIIISHFGTLGGTRDLQFFLQGLSLFLNEHPIFINKIKVKIYGSIGKKEREQIQCFQYKGIVEYLGKVSREEALTRMIESDILLLIQNRSEVSIETIPSKTYEYLHSGRLILALVYRNLELKEMLEKSGHVVVDAANEISIKEGISKCVQKLKDFTPLVSPYSIRNAVNELLLLTKTE